ncbi:hypothetical protein CU254_25665 [Amycolatopsis sp. AA4]|nr:hypothetical protein CU254_25665 [Amycolatopsis sp. AA4]EFL09382.1 predicted protein [Streptomyces sp. AA4]
MMFMRLRQIVALCATTGLVGAGLAVGTAGVAAAAQAAPSAYGYIAGASGSLPLGYWPSGANILSAAAPAAPEFDPGAKVPGNATKSVSVPVGDINLLLEGDGVGGGVLAVDTTANPATGVSTAKAAALTARADVKLTAGKLIDSIIGGVPDGVGKRLLLAAKAFAYDAEASVKFSLSGLGTSCQAGPAGTPAAAEASRLKVDAEISIAGWAPFPPVHINQPLGGKAVDVPGLITIGTGVVNDLPDGGISADAASVSVAGKSLNLGHVECHPGVLADGQE